MDHTVDERFIEDVDHMSAGCEVSAPVGGGKEPVLRAWLTEYPASSNGALLALDAAGTGEVAELSAAEALAFADQLVAHAAQIKVLAEAMTD
ncbi:hypothetical protein Q8723_03775 [Streptomyces cacaoi]|nr:hypothetical protein [Streptomyces sp. NRRL S-1868]